MSERIAGKQILWAWETLESNPKGVLMEHDELLKLLQEQQPEREWRLNLHVDFWSDAWAIRQEVYGGAVTVRFHAGIEPEDVNPEALMGLVN